MKQDLKKPPVSKVIQVATIKYSNNQILYPEFRIRVKRNMFGFLRLELLTLPLIPILVSSGYLLFTGITIKTNLLLLFTISALLGFYATYLLNEYNDFFNGICRDDLPGSGGILVKRALLPETILKLSVLSYLLAGISFISIVKTYPLEATLYGTICLLAGYCYSSAPLGYKYKGFGEFAAFLFFGPICCTGVSFVATGMINQPLLIHSIPIAFMSLAVLHCNNMSSHCINYENYEKTLAMVLGSRRSLILLYFLLTIPFVLVTSFIARKVLPDHFYMVYLLLPYTLIIARKASNVPWNLPEKLKPVVAHTAVYHFLFGLLYAGCFGWNSIKMLLANYF